MQYAYDIFEKSNYTDKPLSSELLRNSFYTYIQGNDKSLNEIALISGISKRKILKIFKRKKSPTLDEVSAILFAFGKESVLTINDYGSNRKNK